VTVRNFGTFETRSRASGGPALPADCRATADQDRTRTWSRRQPRTKPQTVPSPLPPLCCRTHDYRLSGSPEDRYSIHTMKVPGRALRILRLDVDEGFLDGVSIEFASGLNVLIGARGVGKTSVLELIRFVLGAPWFTTDAEARGRQQVRSVLGERRETRLRARPGL
jgi:hypothetical protein